MTKGGLFQRYGVLVAFVLLFAVAAFRQPEMFLQPDNLKNLLNQNAAVGIVSVGMTLVIVAGGIDLSVGSMLALAGALGMLAMNKGIAIGWGQWPSAMAGVAAAVVTGTAMGAINGFLVAYGRIAPFVATLVGLVGYRSMCLALAEGGEIRSSSPEVFPSLASGGIPLPFLHTASGAPVVITWSIVLFLGIALVAGFLLNRTRFGRYSIAVGANERAARFSAINVNATKFWTYVFVGALTGLASITVAARMNSVTSSQQGLYYELDAIAAIVIGGTKLTGGYGRIWGTVVGVVLLGIITNVLVLEDVSVYWQGFVKGLIILAAVLIQRGKE